MAGIRSRARLGEGASCEVPYEITSHLVGAYGWTQVKFFASLVLPVLVYRAT